MRESYFDPCVMIFDWITWESNTFDITSFKFICKLRCSTEFCCADRSEISGMREQNAPTRVESGIYKKWWCRSEYRPVSTNPVMEMNVTNGRFQTKIWKLIAQSQSQWFVVQVWSKDIIENDQLFRPSSRLTQGCCSFCLAYRIVRIRG